MEQSLTIYKASAGSGKTFALAVEYIMGLLLPHAENEFVHTLAVTFTNKATAEMKGRILARPLLILCKITFYFFVSV